MRKIKNKNLYQSFIELAVEAKKSFSSKDLKSLEQNQIESYINIDLKEQLQRTQTYSNFLNVLKADKIIISHRNKSISAGIGAYSFVSEEQLLDHILPLTIYFLIFSKDSDIIKKLYSDFEGLFYDEQLEFETIAPLQGFNCLREDLSKRTATSRYADDETEPLIIDDCTKLSPLTEEERAEVHQLQLIRNHYFRMTDTLYAIKIKYKNKKFVQDRDDYSTELQEQSETSQNTIKTQIDDILIALRLYKSGSIYIGGLLHKSKNLFFNGVISLENRTLINPFINIKPYDFYLSEDGENFKNLLSDFLSLKPNGKGNLVTASRWLSYSCENERIEDRVINLMIGAEALADSKGNQNKKKVILDKIPDLFPSEKTDVYNLFKNLYELRNSIVHEGSMDSWTKNNPSIHVMNLIMNGEEWIRKGVIKLL